MNNPLAACSLYNCGNGDFDAGSRVLLDFSWDSCSIFVYSDRLSLSFLEFVLNSL